MSGFNFKGLFIKLLGRGRQPKPWPGCKAYSGMTEETCNASMHELAGCFLCRVRRRAQERTYRAKARQVAETALMGILLVVLAAGTVNALGTSSIWRGKVYSTVRQYGTIKIINESGTVVKTITLRGFPNYTASIAFGNWTTPATAGTYTALYNISSINGKVSYSRTLVVDAPVAVDAHTIWNYTGTGGRTLTASALTASVLWNYTGGKAKHLDAHISTRADQTTANNISASQGQLNNNLLNLGISLADKLDTSTFNGYTGYIKKTTTDITFKSQTGIAAYADRRLSRTHPGDWSAASGAGAGTAMATGFDNSSTAYPILKSIRSLIMIKH